ncbi:flagellar biosynthesis protein FlhB [Oceanidesulfovibrio indonesiensis]|uniref:Flagellar biosynthetic protein FlhB n=1 Tax=Oceanidesulfovibrio indonesiensis TaxID=54767 RepID=A0A7M3MFD9_9BACT|nr:flagellar biosynthesis protein FlhB [Oceanidesulfovibrio indonesiensis]TVM17153.1 flagellar biosynthesis protein FlhB [Oceanidesulfovibrio indonesiensis]
MPQTDPSRTEEPTQKRLDKARDEGNVPRSQEVAKTFVLLCGVLMLKLYLSYVAEDLQELFRFFMRGAATFELNQESLIELFVMIVKAMAIMVVPVMLALAVFAFFSNFLQVGPLWTTKVFEPKFSKMFNIVAGMQRLFFSAQTLVRLGKSMGQAFVIAIVAYVMIKGKLDESLPMFYQPAKAVAAHMLETGADMVLWILVPLFIITALDVWYTRWDYIEQLKMTKDEVKDERKQMEGDQQVKQQQKQKMLQVSGQRMMAQVPNADVVITNPTHIAVALRYDVNEAPAPQVLAKGANAVAERIKEIARENNVPVRENKPLARALYKSVEVGEVIPEEMYQAVATILAQVFKNKGKAGPAG